MRLFAVIERVNENQASRDALKGERRGFFLASEIACVQARTLPDYYK
jgi:hypothetical protein